MQSIEAIKSRHTGERWLEGSQPAAEELQRQTASIRERLHALKQRYPKGAHALLAAYGVKTRSPSLDAAWKALEDRILARLGNTVRGFA